MRTTCPRPIRVHVESHRPAMCGIAGILNHRPDRPARDEMARMLRIMLDAMIHRGPDDEGTFITDQIALGSRRLAINDLSDAGHQPIGSPDGVVQAVINGEIYNYRELMTELKAQGAEFKSTCDSEVVVHAYLRDGLDMLHRFNGMWGMALWDARLSQLLLVRDRLGVKPLYYCEVNDYLLFASETKALLPFLPRPIRLDERHQYGMLRRHDDDPRRTPYQDIHQLPAGALARLRAGESLSVHQYWELEETPEPTQVSPKEAQEEFREIFHDSVRLRMTADAPLTYFISGGIDSTAVVGMANFIDGKGQRAIASMYDDPDKDERRYINDAIRHGHLDATIISHEPQGDLLDVMRKIVWMLDGSSSGQGNILQWYLFKTVREQHGCKVVLSGNGGDEVMSGYHPYFRTYLNSLIRDYRVTGRKRLLGRFLIDALMLRVVLGRSYVFNYPITAFEGRARQRMRRYRRWLEKGVTSTGIPLDETLNDDFIASYDDDETSRPQAKFIEHQTWLGLRRTIMPALLRYEDRMSMAWSVECRQPFLDYRLVEFVTKLPYQLKTRGIWNKRLARVALRDVMPRSVRRRINKMGLPTPLARWLRTTERDSCRDYLLDAVQRRSSLFDPEGVRALFNSHLDESVDASTRLYVLLTSCLWLDLMDEENARPSFWEADAPTINTSGCRSAQARGDGA